MSMHRDEPSSRLLLRAWATNFTTRSSTDQPADRDDLRDPLAFDRKEGYFTSSSSAQSEGEVMSMGSISDLGTHGLDELVPSRYAVSVGDIDVLVISDGVLPITAKTQATNADATE